MNWERMVVNMNREYLNSVKFSDDIWLISELLDKSKVMMNYLKYESIKNMNKTKTKVIIKKLIWII